MPFLWESIPPGHPLWLRHPRPSVLTWGASEFHLHVFHSRSIARILRCLSNWPFGISRLPISSPADWIRFLLNVNSELGIRSSSMPLFILNTALIYDIPWFSWNRAIHEGKAVIISDLQQSLASRYIEHHVAWISHASSFYVTWTPPPLQVGWRSTLMLLYINMDST